MTGESIDASLISSPAGWDVVRPAGESLFIAEQLLVHHPAPPPLLLVPEPWLSASHDKGAFCSS